VDALLPILFGVLVGVSLGLTGGGGSLFAVPLLVHGLGIEPREAVGLSLIVVGAVAWAGWLRRSRSGTIEPRAAAFIAGAGIVSAPLGVMAAQHLDPDTLMAAFSGLMLVVAALMVRQTFKNPENSAAVRARHHTDEAARGIACRYDARGKLDLSTRCAFGLLGTGLLTGFLTGLFGVGGGFLIVPALMFATGMSVNRAVGTSLMVIALVSLSGIAGFVLRGPHPGVWSDGGLMLVGGIVGLEAGTLTASRIAGVNLQRIFAALIVGTALWTGTRALFG
jgi:uncharacterized membrane protein YfcA